MEEPNFTRIIKNQIEVGEFLKSFDPILMPFENIAKYGIALASVFFGIGCTLFNLFEVPLNTENNYDWMLFCSWVLFLGSSAFGGLELYRTLKFRDQMRKFSYVLLGDKPNGKDKTAILKKSHISAVIIELILLGIGMAIFIFWVLCKINL